MNTSIRIISKLIHFIQDLYKSQLTLQKLDEIVTRKIIEFAKKYSFEIDDQVLNNFILSELNTFTYKLIGFGGRIAAFPIAIPMFVWYYIMQEEETSLP